MSHSHSQSGASPPEPIPTIDLGPWFDPDGRSRITVARTVHAVCREVGFLYVKNHGVPRDVIDDALRSAHRFFALPEERKRRVHYERSGFHRGYVPIAAESTDPTARGDHKEAFDCGLQVAASNPDCPAAERMQSPNLWPEELPGFPAAVERYFAAVTDLARTLFQIFAVGFGLDEGYFDREVTEPIAQLRLLHYPEQAPSAAGDWGIGAHSDYECFTILAQDDVGGLQIQGSEGTWIDVPPIDGTFVINIGEMMARWTNDAFRSTPHRVTNPTGRDRYSLAFFFATNYDTVITCLESCTSDQNPVRYAPVTAGDYLASRLKEIYGH